MKLTTRITAAYYFSGIIFTYRDGSTAIFDGTSHETPARLLSAVAYHLLLTPLSAITDEHAIEVAKMATNAMSDCRYTVNPNVNDYGYGDNMHEDVKCVGVEVFNGHPSINAFVKMYLIQIDTEEYDITKGYYDGTEYKDECPENNVPIIDYLRSNGYDCGYGSIPSLIAAGIAIDKTTLK